jgi:hypothetical protein
VYAVYLQVRINYCLFVSGRYYPLESERPDANQQIHAHNETSRDEATWQEVTGNRALPRGSTGSLTEESALSRKFTVNPTDISSVHKDLDETEDTKSQSIFNENTIINTSINTSNPVTLLSENGSEITSDQMVGTFSERLSKMFTTMYRNLPVGLEKQIINVTTENFSNRSEVSDEGEYRMVGDQPKYLSAEIDNPYPRVATENAYIILYDMFSNPTEPSTTQTDLSSGNSTEIQYTKDIGEDYSAGSSKHSIEEANECSETSTTEIFSSSTGKDSILTTHQLLSNRRGNEPDRSGKWDDTTRISSRSTRDHSGSTGRRMETSKLNSSRNADDNVQFSSVTADTVSIRQTIERSSQRDTKLPTVRAISSSTENVSRNPGGQLISITVQNPPQFSSISTESASKTSSDSSRNYFNALFEGTARPSGGDELKKDSPIGE